MAHAVVLLFICCTTSSLAQRFNPIAFTLPPPPTLTGALSPNYALYNVEKLHNGRINGPTSFAFLNGSVYTVTADRKVVDVATCIPKLIVNLSTPRCTTHASCGMLTSIRVGADDQLLVLDAYRGLYKVNPANGAVRQLYSSTKPVGGRLPRYLNDMVQTADGVILISDSSDKFDLINDIYIIMEGRPSGRILALNPDTGAVTEVLRDVVVYPNGLELTADGTGLLMAETGRARILRVSLLAATYKQVTIFANNLPGVPENIRRSSRGTFWVALSLVRHRGIPNSMDMFSNNPAARLRTVTNVNQNTIRSYYPKYGFVVELDRTGKIIGSLHDPSGRVYSSVSEVSEQDGLLYMGSPNTAFTGRIVLPQGDGRIVTVDSVIQVMRSRCQVPEDKLAQAKIVLNRYIEQQTGFKPNGVQTTTTSATQSSKATSPQPALTTRSTETTTSKTTVTTKSQPTTTTMSQPTTTTTTQPTDTTKSQLTDTTSPQSTLKTSPSTAQAPTTQTTEVTTGATTVTTTTQPPTTQSTELTTESTTEATTTQSISTETTVTP